MSYTNHHVQERILVAIDDLVFPLEQSGAVVIELVVNFGQVLCEARFIIVIVRIMHRMVERVNQVRSGCASSLWIGGMHLKSPLGSRTARPVPQIMAQLVSFMTLRVISRVL